MKQKIKEGKTILYNTVTRCTFIANDLDEQVQTGTRKSDNHIEWVGELDIAVIIPKSEIVCQHLRVKEEISGGRRDVCLDCGKVWG